MNDFDPLEIYKSTLSDRDFSLISNYIKEHYGIKLPPEKKMLVQNRLYKRLRALQIKDFHTYVEYVFSQKGQNELMNLVDALTTNKTDFFREKLHFDFLKQTFSPFDNLKIWSAACSTGEEPYSIAIVMQQIGCRYRIYATDLSFDALTIAKNGIYPERKLENIDEQIKQKFFRKISFNQEVYYQVKQFVKSRITFSQMNLMNEIYPLPKDFDVIFLRNVLIYFDQPTQNSVIRKVLKYLKTGGYLILGLAEAILNEEFTLKKVQSSIYQKI